MIIEKFLNNNMLLVNDNHEEMIVMGKGLRFHYKVGDEILSCAISMMWCTISK